MMAAMSETLTLRRATLADIAAVDTLLQRSYGRLLAADYPPSVRVTAIPLISRANPALLRSGAYFVITDGDGRAAAAGGWSWSAPIGGRHRRGRAHVRHLAVDPERTRLGLARRILQAILSDLTPRAPCRLEALSTLTAEPFYRALSFARIEAVEVPLRPGIVFPSVRMLRKVT